MKIVVIPNVLSFESIGQKISFKVRVLGQTDQSIISGSLIWFDEAHQVQVRSPALLPMFPLKLNLISKLIKCCLVIIMLKN